VPLAQETAHGPPKALLSHAAGADSPRHNWCFETSATQRDQFPKLRTRVRFPSPALSVFPRVFGVFEVLEEAKNRPKRAIWRQKGDISFQSTFEGLFDPD